MIYNYASFDQKYQKYQKYGIFDRSMQGWNNVLLFMKAHVCVECRHTRICVECRYLNWNRSFCCVSPFFCGFSNWYVWLLFVILLCRVSLKPIYVTTCYVLCTLFLKIINYHTSMLVMKDTYLKLSDFIFLLKCISIYYRVYLFDTKK